jgi:glycosyltransferase involved in cell wall biosynthesis
LGLVVYRNVRAASAIDEYSRHLVRALRAAGEVAEYTDRGLGPVARLERAPRWILLQYNPNSFGRRGFAPALVRDAYALRRRWPGTRFALMVHEAWEAMTDWRSTAAGLYQRAQLRALLRLADPVLVSREALVRELPVNAVHLPVASNITPVTGTRERAREHLDIAGQLVVTLFGTGHPSRALDHAVAAIEALRDRHGAAGLRVLNLGRGAPPLDVDVTVDTPGELDAEAVSLRLRASDLLLLPFYDGVSTRRGTLMAGLAHGIPIVGLRGDNTDGVLLHHHDAMVLTPVGDLRAYARAVVALSADPERRRATGRAGRRLYAAEFDWPVLAARVSALLSDRR